MNSSQQIAVPTANAGPVYSDTAARILDIAERLVAERGFNSVSYADIAIKLGMTKPSLHYHFASKTDLGVALIERYQFGFAAALDRLDSEPLTPADKLTGYVGLYLDVLRDGRMCLCGMLAAEFLTLPESMQQAVLAFFDTNETWLVSVLDQGRSDGSLYCDGESRDCARTIINTLEGAMLIARPYSDPSRFEATATSLLQTLSTPA